MSEQRKANKQYGIEYEYAGSKWMADVWADDANDAQRKLRAMAYGEVVGELKAVIRVPTMIERVLGWFGIKP